MRINSKIETKNSVVLSRCNRIENAVKSTNFAIRVAFFEICVIMYTMR